MTKPLACAEKLHRAMVRSMKLDPPPKSDLAPKREPIPAVPDDKDAGDAHPNA